MAETAKVYDPKLLKKAQRLAADGKRTESLVNLQKRTDWLAEENNEAVVSCHHLKVLFLDTKKPVVVVDCESSHPLDSMGIPISPTTYVRRLNSHWSKIIQEFSKTLENKQPIYNVYFGHLEDHGDYLVFNSCRIDETSQALVLLRNPEPPSISTNPKENYLIIDAPKLASTLKLYQAIQTEENYDFLVNEQERKRRKEKQKQIRADSLKNREAFIAKIKELFPDDLDFFMFGKDSFRFSTFRDGENAIDSPYVLEEEYFSQIINQVKHKLAVYKEAKERSRMSAEAEKWIRLWLADPKNNVIAEKLSNEPRYIGFYVEYYGHYKVKLVGVESDDGISEELFLISKNQEKFIEEFAYKLDELLTVRQSKRAALGFIVDFFEKNKSPNN